MTKKERAEKIMASLSFCPAGTSEYSRDVANVARQLASAVLAEREACARMCENHYLYYENGDVAEEIAARIRARRVK